MVKKLDASNIKDKATDRKDVSNHDEDVSSKEDKLTLSSLPGVGPKTAQKLRDLGYKTLLNIATARADAIAAEMGQSVSYTKAKSWIMAAQEKVMGRMKLKKGSDVEKDRDSKRIHFKTGSTGFNNLIDGGFATMRTTGLSGRFSTGKTQCVNDAIVSCLSQGYEAVYIETEPDTYKGSRLEEIATHRKLDIDLDKLWICEASQIPTMKAQFLQYKVVQKALENGSNIKLVAVDSFTAKIRAGYGRREMLPIRTRELAEHFLLMDYLSAKYNVAWILTCQVIGAPDPGQTLGMKMLTGDSYIPVGGNFLLHSMNLWVSLQQVKTELYKAIVFDSSYIPRSSCEFMISRNGLSDGVK